MTDTRKFTPPTEFPSEYVNGKGERVTLIGKGRGKYPLVGQLDAGDMGDAFFPFTEDGRDYVSDSGPHPDDLHDLHDLPKRIVRWRNVYQGTATLGQHSREDADKLQRDNRICVHRIECDEDGSNPEIFFEKV